MNHVSDVKYRLKDIIKSINIQDNSCKDKLFAVEILTDIGSNYPKPLLDFWGNNLVKNTLEWFKEAQKEAVQSGASFISVYFNFDEPADKDLDSLIMRCQKLLRDIQQVSFIPLIVRGSGQKHFDEILIPKLVEVISKPSIVALGQDTNYKKIVESILKSPLKDSLYLTLRAPIDINLSKEINVLTSDAGLSFDKIIMDTDTGCVGLGLDYGYSIIERIVLARKAGDRALSSPIIVFSGEETYKAKESKSSDFKDYRGDLKTRSLCWEISTTVSLLLAGANIAVCWNPQAISLISKTLKEGEDICQWV